MSVFMLSTRTEVALSQRVRLCFELSNGQLRCAVQNGSRVCGSVSPKTHDCSSQNRLRHLWFAVTGAVEFRRGK